MNKVCECVCICVFSPILFCLHSLLSFVGSSFTPHCSKSCRILPPCMWGNQQFYKHNYIRRCLHTTQDTQETLKPLVNTPSYKVTVLVQHALCHSLQPLSDGWRQNIAAPTRPTPTTQRAHQITASGHAVPWLSGDCNTAITNCSELS